jgi:hypothetical protein
MSPLCDITNLLFKNTFFSNAEKFVCLWRQLILAIGSMPFLNSWCNLLNL